MTRVCFTLRIRRGRLDEYRQRHAEVWPEMQQALKESGWSNYSLFLDDDGLLVGYLETDDFTQAQARMAARNVNDRWQAQMREFFEGADESRPDERMRPLREIFHLP